MAVGDGRNDVEMLQWAARSVAMGQSGPELLAVAGEVTGPVEEGDEVPSYYDPLVSKLVAWGEDRASAIARMRRAVREYKVLGIKTTLPFFERVLRHPDFLAGRIDTSFVERLGREKQAEEERPWAVAAAAAAIGALARRRAARTTPGAGPAPSAWRREGRREGMGGRG